MIVGLRRLFAESGRIFESTYGLRKLVVEGRTFYRVRRKVFTKPFRHLVARSQLLWTTAMIIECGSVTGVVVVLTALPLLLLAAIFEIVTVFVGKTELSHFLLLVMPPDQAEERVGDLTEAALVVIEKHGHRYAKFWYMWTGFWIIAATIVSKAPGKRLIDAVIGRISRE